MSEPPPTTYWIWYDLIQSWRPLKATRDTDPSPLSEEPSVDRRKPPRQLPRNRAVHLRSTATGPRIYTVTTRCWNDALQNAERLPLPAQVFTDVTFRATRVILAVTQKKIFPNKIDYPHAWNPRGLTIKSHWPNVVVSVQTLLLCFTKSLHKNIRLRLQEKRWMKRRLVEQKCLK